MLLGCREQKVRSDHSRTGTARRSSDLERQKGGQKASSSAQEQEGPVASRAQKVQRSLCSSSPLRLRLFKSAREQFGRRWAREWRAWG